MLKDDLVPKLRHSVKMVLMEKGRKKEYGKGMIKKVKEGYRVVAEG